MSIWMSHQLSPISFPQTPEKHIHIPSDILKSKCDLGPPPSKSLEFLIQLQITELCL